LEDGAVLWAGATHLETRTLIRKTLLFLWSWLSAHFWEGMDLKERGEFFPSEGAEQECEGQNNG